MTALLLREKEPSCFTAVITPPVQIHMIPERETANEDVSHLFVSEFEIQSMISDILDADISTPKLNKHKGPPPPVPKKPKNPFSKVAAIKASNEINEPRQYSDLLLQNIKLGRQEASTESNTEDFHPNLDMMSYYPERSFSPSYIYMTECLNSGFDPEDDVSRIYPHFHNEETEHWTETDEIPPVKEQKRKNISQVRRMLEQKAKMKGPPPPVPKKPIKTRVAPEKESLPEIDFYECDYEPYLYLEDQQTEPTYTPNRCSVPDAQSESDENGFVRYRPVSELIKETNMVHEGRIYQGSQINVNEQRGDHGHQSNKILQMTKNFSVKKPPTSETERKLSPRRGTSNPRYVLN